MLWKEALSKVLWTKWFIGLITDLHVVINVQSSSYHVKFVKGNILVKLLMSSGIDETITRVITGKGLGGMNINKLDFLLISKV